MWTAHETIIVDIIAIRQCPSRDWQWDVTVTIRKRDTDNPKTTIEITSFDRKVYDPISTRKHEEISHYLNFLLNDDSLDEKEAAETSSNIDKYRRDLFKSLRFEESHKEHFHGKRLELRIREKQSGAKGSRSIMSIHWEHLEDLRLWTKKSWGLKVGPNRVTVQRYVDGNRGPHKFKRTESIPTHELRNDETFNILLVVARKYVHSNASHEVDYFSPASVQAALLEAQAELEFRQARNRLHVEVVRPGSFDELKEHLARRFKNGCIFHAVHLDMHGGIRQVKDNNHEAYLEFNKYCKPLKRSMNSAEKVNGGADEQPFNQLGNEQVPAGEIADVLVKREIYCAVLSACKSAQADLSAHANCASSFLDAGIISVLAMSYNMPDTMSRIFYSRFYHEIFIGRERFAAAATVARTWLRDDPRRWSYEHERNFDVQDWFVPVVYSNGHEDAVNKYPGIGRSVRLRDSRYLYLFVIMMLLSVSVTLYGFVFMGRKHPYRYMCRDLTPLFVYSLFVGPRYWKKYWFHRRLRALSQDRKNILRIEGDLRHSQKIFLHTSNDFLKTAPHLLEVLTDIWRRTHLVEHIVVIQADWFIQHFSHRMFVRSLYRMFQLWIRSLSPGLKLLSSASVRHPTIVVVINGIESIYPEPRKFQAYHGQAQQNFNAWLTKYIKTGSKMAKEEANKYLILVGEVPSEGVPAWFAVNAGTCSALKGTSMTQYMNLGDFIHTPENRPASRSWIG